MFLLSCPLLTITYHHISFVFTVFSTISIKHVLFPPFDAVFLHFPIFFLSFPLHTIIFPACSQYSIFYNFYNIILQYSATTPRYFPAFLPAFSHAFPLISSTITFSAFSRYFLAIPSHFPAFSRYSFVSTTIQTQGISYPIFRIFPTDLRPLPQVADTEKPVNLHHSLVLFTEFPTCSTTFHFTSSCIHSTFSLHNLKIAIQFRPNTEKKEIWYSPFSFHSLKIATHFNPCQRVPHDIVRISTIPSYSLWQLPEYPKLQRVWLEILKSVLFFNPFKPIYRPRGGGPKSVKHSAFITFLFPSCVWSYFPAFSHVSPHFLRYPLHLILFSCAFFQELVLISSAYFHISCISSHLWCYCPAFSHVLALVSSAYHHLPSHFFRFHRIFYDFHKTCPVSSVWCCFPAFSHIFPLISSPYHHISCIFTVFSRYSIPFSCIFTVFSRYFPAFSQLSSSVWCYFPAFSHVFPLISFTFPAFSRYCLVIFLHCPKFCPPFDAIFLHFPMFFLSFPSHFLHFYGIVSLFSCIFPSFALRSMLFSCIFFHTFPLISSPYGISMTSSSNIQPPKWRT